MTRYPVGPSRIFSFRCEAPPSEIEGDSYRYWVNAKYSARREITRRVRISLRFGNAYGNTDALYCIKPAC